jgi:hypothetical protein
VPVRSNPAPVRRPAAVRPAGSSGARPIRGTPGGDRRIEAAPRRPKRRSAGRIVTTIVVIIVLVLIYFGSFIAHILSQVFSR